MASRPPYEEQKKYLKKIKHIVVDRNNRNKAKHSGQVPSDLLQFLINILWACPNSLEKSFVHP